MPQYEFKCDVCEQHQLTYVPIRDYDKMKSRMLCCGKAMNHFITPGNLVITDIQPYVSPVDGTVIRSRQAEAAHKKKHKITHSDDYTEFWASEEKRRQRHRDGEFTTAERKELKQDIANSIEMAQSSGYVPESIKQAHLPELGDE